MKFSNIVFDNPERFIGQLAARQFDEIIDGMKSKKFVHSTHNHTMHIKMFFILRVCVTMYASTYRQLRNLL